jgi:hypothetical protein
MAIKKRSVASKSKKSKSKTKFTKSSVGTYQSFKVAKPCTPFFKFAITQQTLYWGILSCVVLLFGLWIIHIQIEIYNIYDEIDRNNMLSQSIEAENN